MPIDFDTAKEWVKINFPERYFFLDLFWFDKTKGIDDIANLKAYYWVHRLQFSLDRDRKLDCQSYSDITCDTFSFKTLSILTYPYGF